MDVWFLFVDSTLDNTVIHFYFGADLISVISVQAFFIFVLRKKGSETKERMKEEEIEKGDCGPPTRKVFFWGWSGESIDWLSRIRTDSDGPVVYPANACDSRLRGD